MIKKISITFFSKVLNSVLGLLNTILITQFLGAEGKGLTTLFMTSLSLCLLFCQIIGGNSLVYLSSRLPVSALLISSYIWTVFVSLILPIILYVAGFCPQDFFIELVAVSILFALFNTHLFILLGKEKSILYNLLSPAPQLFQLLAGIFLFITLQIHSIHTYIYYLYFVFGGSYFISLLFIIPEMSKLRMPDNETINTLWKYGSRSQASNILFFFNNRIFFYLLGYYFIKTEVGIYSVGVMIIESVLLIGNSFSLMLYSRIANSNSVKESILLTKKYGVLSFGLTVFALSIVAFIPADVYSMLFGADFYPVKKIALYLCPGALLMSIYYVTSSYFSGTGKYMNNNYAVGLGLLISVVGGFMFIPSGDMFAAAIVTSVALSTIAICSLIQFKREIKKNNSLIYENSPF